MKSLANYINEAIFSQNNTDEKKLTDMLNNDKISAEIGKADDNELYCALSINVTDKNVDVEKLINDAVKTITDNKTIGDKIITQIEVYPADNEGNSLTDSALEELLGEELYDEWTENCSSAGLSPNDEEGCWFYMNI